MLNFDTKRAIIKATFEGFGRNAIYKQIKRTRRNLSSSTVTRVQNEFSNEVDSTGIREAAVKYGVNKEVTDLLEIANIKRVNNLQTTDMASGAKIYQSLKRLGIESDEHENLEAFITSVYKRVEKDNLDFSDILKQINEIQEIEKKYEIDFDTLKSDYDRLGQSVPKLREEHKKLTGEIKEKSSRKFCCSRVTTPTKTD